MSSLARWCFRRRWLVLALWLVALFGSFAASRAVGTDFSTKFSLPNVQSAQALNLLDKDFPAASGSSDQIVVSIPSGSVRDPEVQARVTQMLAEVARLPHVRVVVSPYSPAGGGQISADGRVAFATVVFDAQTQNVPKSAVVEVIHTAQAARSGDLQVNLAGPDIENALKPSSSSSTAAGVIFALIVLGLAFGALLAAFLPLITALVAIGIGYALTGLLSHVFNVASFATILGVLIGLGVGVDYALFIVTRHRNAITSGATPEDAVAAAINTAGRAVFFAGLTVCIALLGQFALGLSFLYGIAVSASLTVILTMLASLTLLPALLGFLKMRVLSRRQRARLAATGPTDPAATGFWNRWATMIERHAALPAALSAVLVVVIAAPVLSLHLGLDDAGSDPQGSTTLGAYDQLARGFGPGFSGPLLLVAQLPSAGDTAPFAALTTELAREPGVVSLSPIRVSPNGRVATASLYPTTSPQSPETTVLLDRLRNHVIPQAQAGSGMTVLIGGTTAIQTDFAHVLSSKLLLFLAVVVILGFLLLMAVFRSLLVPLVASVMNLLSVGAALGIMNVVFEWGWGKSLMRLHATAPVEVFLPVILISILFGLSMDYEVFLVSRIHEEWMKTGDNRRAVTVGQAATGRVITAAATIMILVFASFALGDQVIIKQFGIGLAGALLIDAFIVRTFVVPALMHMFGKANWWLPAWLDRALPDLNVEGADRSVPPILEPVPVTVSAE